MAVASVMTKRSGAMPRSLALSMSMSEMSQPCTSVKPGRVDFDTRWKALNRARARPVAIDFHLKQSVASPMRSRSIDADILQQSPWREQHNAIAQKNRKQPSHAPRIDLPLQL